MDRDKLYQMVDFNQGFTVIIGMNNAGKHDVLDALTSTMTTATITSCPENGTHRAKFREMVKDMREFAENRKMFIITYSPYFLDYIRPEEVLVVRRVDGETTVSRVHPSIKDYLGNIGLGEYWSSFGEDGLVDGVEFRSKNPASSRFGAGLIPVFLSRYPKLRSGFSCSVYCFSPSFRLSYAGTTIATGSEDSGS